MPRLVGLLLCASLFGWTAPVRAVAPPSPVIAAVGDIACDPADPSYNGGLGTASACQMKATSDLVVGAGYTAVLILGDNQYEDGTLAKYQQSYDATWGRVKGITRPIPGNHDYANGGSQAQGYYTYFGAAAADPAKGYYSYDLGAWHMVALNSNCTMLPGGCGAGSPEAKWLEEDLAAVSGKCILAYWHHPRFSSGSHGDDPNYDAFWRALYRAGADVVLVGHDHHYERYDPQGPAATADAAGGIREFVVGTGGRNLTATVAPRPNSALQLDNVFGILKMTLAADRYSWQFVNSATGAVQDTGTAFCHRRATPRGARFYTIPPCRVADTRDAGSSAVGSARTRTFPVTGKCGIPSAARSVVLNVTAIVPTAAGNLRLFPAGGVTSSSSMLNFRAGQIRAAATAAGLGQLGQITVYNDSAGTVHLAIDATGYFLE